MDFWVDRATYINLSPLKPYNIQYYSINDGHLKFHQMNTECCTPIEKKNGGGEKNVT